MQTTTFSTRIQAVLLGGALTLAMAFSAQAEEPSGPVIRVGMIGCDTSHVVGFSQEINDPASGGFRAKVQITCAYPGGSADIPKSHDRVEGFTKELRGMSIEIVPSIEKLLEQVDAVMLMSIDGRVHIDQLRPILAAKKTVYINKPLGSNLVEVVAINRLAEEAGVPWFSISTLRYAPDIDLVAHNEKIGKILGCSAYSPCALEPHHSDLFWYGIHGTELLYAIMGPGCETVSRVHTEGLEFVTGTWKEGRIGTFRGIREGSPNYGFTVFGTNGIASSKGQTRGDSMEMICKFLVTGEPPVPNEETIEIYTFLEAAAESSQNGGIPVKMSEVLERATKASLQKFPAK